MDILRSSLKNISLKGSRGTQDPDFAPATIPAPEPFDEAAAPLGPPVRLAVIGAGQRGRVGHVSFFPV